jgi:hypothetical protein
MTTMAETLARTYALNHRNALQAVGDLGEDQLYWRPPRSNTIAFNIWHMARWADHLQSILSTMTPALRERMDATDELWTRGRLAEKWGLPTTDLGSVQTGMGMDEDVSASLVLPRHELFIYVNLAFAAGDHAVQKVRDEDLAVPAELEAARAPWLKSPAEYGTVGSWIVVSIRHESRHLGMIEALKGAAGLRGTATV